MPGKLKLIGQRFGKLTVTREATASERGNARGSHWACRCDCGSDSVIRRGKTLSGGDSKHCGCDIQPSHQINVAGERYGMLVAISRIAGPTAGQGHKWLFRCDCGNEKTIRLKDVRYGNTASCGCIKPLGRKVVQITRPWERAA